MDNLKFKKLPVIAGIVIAIAVAFILVESGTFKSNVKNAKADSTIVKPR